MPINEILKGRRPSRRDLPMIFVSSIIGLGAGLSIVTNPIAQSLIVNIKKQEFISGIAAINPGMQELEHNYNVLLAPGGWNQEHLALLTEYLSVLPIHFYGRVAKVEKANLL